MPTCASKAPPTPASAPPSAAPAGVSIDAGHGTVYVAADSVSTTQSFSRGITADSSDGTTVFVNDVTTLGKYSPGIVATVTGPTFARGPAGSDVDSGTISTAGKYSDGIVATNPLGTVDDQPATSIHTTGSDSDGITATAQNDVTITSGSVVTTATRVHRHRREQLGRRHRHRQRHRPDQRHLQHRHQRATPRSARSTFTSTA